MTYLAKEEAGVQTPVIRRGRSFIGACFELLLFALALLFLLPMPSSDRAGYEVMPLVSPLVFSVYCFVAWRRAGKAGGMWLAKGVIFAAFALVFITIVGDHIG